MPPENHAARVLRFDDLDAGSIVEQFARFGLNVCRVKDDTPIPGSFWGDPEAGIIGNCIFVRTDTPVHSLLHEACHFACMSDARRATLDRDAGGDDLEEAAVCYLQILVADTLPGVGRARMMHDMDLWGYSFRLGSTADWFHNDADDALAWLRSEGLIDREHLPLFSLCGNPKH